MRSDLDGIFKPSSIAVVGASRRPGTLSWELLNKLVNTGFTGPVYPVNDKARVIHSIRAYSSVLDIPGPLDLAIIVVPKESVIAMAEECGQRGVKGLVVISAGFREVGPAGAELEGRLLDVVKKYGMRMVGPNCMGVINTEKPISMAATFAQTIPLPGRVGFVSQSGAMGQVILDMLRELEIGISKFASIGNKADVSGNDVLEYLRDDPDTDVILMYLESFGNPFRFSALAKETTRRKPIIVVKAGRTAAGARAASSHTGAMASTDASADALFEECGVIRTNTIEEMFELAMGFSAQPLPRSERFAIVSNAGGPAILATDMAESEGLRMAELSRPTVDALRKVASSDASLVNPVDLVAGATPEVYETSLRAILTDPGVDCALAIFAPTIITPSEGFARAITAASAEFPGKTVTACVVGLRGLKKGLKELKENSIPLYRFPESAVRTIARMVRFREWRERPEGEVRPFDLDMGRIGAVLEPYLREQKPVMLPDSAAKQVLEACGFKFPPEALAPDTARALAAARKMGYPVVLKAILEGITHKTDMGGVMLDIETDEELLAKAGQMVESLSARGLKDRFKGILVQKMVTGGVEVILGAKRDDHFGHLLMFGLGGIAVEVLRDVVFRIAPVTDRTAREMTRAIKGFPLLQGFRGSPGADLPTITEAIQRLSRLVESVKEIDELDVNPMIVGREPGNATALDVRIALRPILRSRPA